MGFQCHQPAPVVLSAGASLIVKSPAGPVLARWGGGYGLERKDRPELRPVILPFVGWNSSNCV